MSRLNEIFKAALERAMKKTKVDDTPLVSMPKEEPKGRQYDYVKKLKTLIKDKVSAGNAAQEFGYMMRSAMNMNPQMKKYKAPVLGRVGSSSGKNEKPKAETKAETKAEPKPNETKQKVSETKPKYRGTAEVKNPIGTDFEYSWQTIDNGLLKAIRYDPITKALDVMFIKGNKEYFYPCVPASAVSAIIGKGGAKNFIHGIHDPNTLNPGHVPQGDAMASRYQKYRSQYQRKPAKSVEEARSELNSMH
mgnify:CR=1 FL=1